MPNHDVTCYDPGAERAASQAAPNDDTSPSKSNPDAAAESPQPEGSASSKPPIARYGMHPGYGIGVYSSDPAPDEAA